MIAEKPESIPINPDFDFLPSHVENVIRHIENCLPILSKKFSTGKTKEKYLNHQLVKSLNVTGHHSYYFAKDETKQDNNYEEDIGVYFNERPSEPTVETLEQIPFFVLEAKRLPMPEFGSAERDEREYVINKKQNGGIERFKREHHGKDLNPCGMIAYIDDKDFSYWFKTINEWLSELAAKNQNATIEWKNDELLKHLSSSNAKTQRFLSKHKRKSDSVSLIHLWVKLN